MSLIVECAKMTNIRDEMRPWRAHLVKCREDDEKHYIGNSKE